MAGTINTWNNQIASANSAITLNAGTNNINIGTDTSSSTINVGTGGTSKGINIGSYDNNGDIIIASNDGNILISKDESSTGQIGIGGGFGTYGINIGLTGAKTIGIGSYNESLMEIEAYSVDMAAPILNISDNANTGTVNLGTGAAAKTVTVGSTNSTSSLALKYGTSDFTLESATGTVMSALDTGEITYPLQPAFFAILPSQVSNVTGNGTVYTLGTGTALTEIYDRNSDFNTNGTFTAPVTGIYTFYCSITFSNPSGGGTEYTVSLVTSNRTYVLLQSPTRSRVTNFFGPNGYLSYSGSVIADMDAADTATITVMASNGTLTSSVVGASSPYTWFGGNLTC